jgi:hypothetical protein
VKTFDDNWYNLKQEKHTVIDADTPTVSLEASNWRVTRWFNNPRQLKIEWREGITKHWAWFDQDEHRGLWRSKEQRVWDEIRTELRNETNLRISRMTARTDQSDAIPDIKMLEIQTVDMIEDINNDGRTKKMTKSLSAVLIINQDTIYYADPKSIKGGISYIFKL